MPVWPSSASENLYDDDGEYAYWTPYALFEALGQTDREMSRLLTAWSGGDFRMTDWFYETVEDLRLALHNLLDVLDVYRALTSTVRSSSAMLSPFVAGDWGLAA